MISPASFVRIDEESATICNAWVERRLVTQRGEPCVTISLLNRSSGRDYAWSGNNEFSFSLSGQLLTGRDLSVVGVESIPGDPCELIVSVESEQPSLGVEIHLQAFAAHPVIRKWLVIRNRGEKEAILSDLDWEDLNLLVDNSSATEVWSDYFSRRDKSVTSRMEDCALLVNDPRLGEGFIIATEAPGPLKRMEAYARPGRIAVGYNRDDETIFEWRLAPNEVFATPAAFILPFANPVPQDVVDGPFAHFVEEQLTVCDVRRVPTVTVNTWEPFETAIHRELLLRQIDAAAEMGVDAYEVDDGWFDRKGDWEVDRKKFPNGLEEIAEYCRARGLRFGLWMAVATVDQESRVCREHPEWIALDRDGQPNRHDRPSEATMCLDSGYFDFILSQIDRVVGAFGVELLKLDLSAVRNVYCPDRYPGCYAANHAHRSHGESHERILARLFDLVRAIRARHPNCLIDVSYELYGVMDGTDLGLTRVADQNWFTNISSPNEGNLRREIYQRGRVTRPWTLNFGGTRLDHPNAPHYGLFSTLTSHALFWGDLEMIDPTTREHYRRWFHWAREQRAYSDFYRYYQVADVFPVPDGESTRDYRHAIPSPRYGIPPRGVHPPGFEPLSGHTGEWWDGVARLDENGEGPVFLFRPAGSREGTFRLRLPWLTAGRRYRVRDETKEEDIGIWAAEELASSGVEVSIDQPARACVLTLRRED